MNRESGLIKYVPSKHEGLSSDPAYPVKSEGVVHAYTPSIKVGQDRRISGVQGSASFAKLINSRLSKRFCLEI